MSKLLVSHREKIIKNVLEATFKTRENELAIAAYNEIYPEDIRKKMDALPDDFFYQTSSIWVEPFRNHIQMSSSKKISASDNSGYHRPVWVPIDDASLQAARQLFKDKSQLRDDRNELCCKLEGMLAGITSIARLKMAWPEGAQYYSFVVAAERKTPNLPAVNCGPINDLIMRLKG